MNEPFTITINYKGEEQKIDAELRLMGYTHKIAVQISNVEIIFEPDEERNYRALVSEADSHSSKMDTELIRLIAAELESTFK